MDISKDKLTNLKQFYMTHGIYPRKKKSGGRRKTALNFAEITRVTRFIINFAEQHSIILPGRIPGFKRDDVKVLPSCETKASIWRYYKAASVEGTACCGLFYIPQIMESPTAIRDYMQANVRFVLDMPTEQFSHHTAGKCA